MYLIYYFNISATLQLTGILSAMRLMVQLKLWEKQFVIQNRNAIALAIVTKTVTANIYSRGKLTTCPVVFHTGFTMLIACPWRPTHLFGYK